MTKERKKKEKKTIGNKEGWFITGRLSIL